MTGVVVAARGVTGVASLPERRFGRLRLGVLATGSRSFVVSGVRGCDAGVCGALVSVEGVCGRRWRVACGRCLFLLLRCRFGLREPVEEAGSVLSMTATDSRANWRVSSVRSHCFIFEAFCSAPGAGEAGTMFCTLGWL